MEWRKIKEFPTYSVSDEGQVRNDAGVRTLKPIQRCNGSYLKVYLYNNGIQKQMYVHRLVAEAFIPNPENKAEVNHKDGNKQNNAVSNLEWCTSSENHLHRCNVLNKRNGSHPVLCIETNITYNSLTEASRATGVQISHLSECLTHNLYKTVGGFHWRYANE